MRGGPFYDCLRSGKVLPDDLLLAVIVEAKDMDGALRLAVLLDVDGPKNASVILDIVERVTDVDPREVVAG
jgi:hypothetical protein